MLREKHRLVEKFFLAAFRAKQARREHFLTAACESSIECFERASKRTPGRVRGGPRLPGQVEEGGLPGLAQVPPRLAEPVVGWGGGHCQVEAEEKEEGQTGRCHFDRY